MIVNTVDESGLVIKLAVTIELTLALVLIALTTLAIVYNPAVFKGTATPSIVIEPSELMFALGIASVLVAIGVLKTVLTFEMLVLPAITVSLTGCSYPEPALVILIALSTPFASSSATAVACTAGVPDGGAISTTGAA